MKNVLEYGRDFAQKIVRWCDVAEQKGSRRALFYGTTFKNASLRALTASLGKCSSWQLRLQCGPCTGPKTLGPLSSVFHQQCII